MDWIRADLKSVTVNFNTLINPSHNSSTVNDSVILMLHFHDLQTFVFDTDYSPISKMAS